MLSARHKAQILARAGVKVPPCPAQTDAGRAFRQQPTKATPGRQHQAAIEAVEPDTAWRRQIDILYSQYSAERAARSLREAEEARLLEALRRTGET